MNITLICVGKTNFRFVSDGLRIYEDRIIHYLNYRRIEIPELKSTRALTPEQIKEKEAELILKHIKPSDKVILLDEKGSSYTSVKWAAQLEKEMISGTKSLTFIIGGAYGFSPQIYDRAQSMISLSEMTFSHQIIRVIFAEQLYRAMTIIKGEPYHNE